jgi:hypothetical protein
MTNQEINSELAKEIKCERQITNKILKLIILAEDRKIALERGYKNTFTWLVKEHKYSPSAANRRIQAARLLRAVPSVETKIEDGSVNLSTLAQAQSMIRNQEILSKQKVTQEQKEEAVAIIENLSGFETEQALMALLPENVSDVKRVSISAIDSQTARLAVNLSNEALADLKRAKEIFAHAIPSGDAGLILARALKELLEKHDPLKKPQRASAADARRATREDVIQKDQGACTFQDPTTGHVCGEMGQIERDHIIPRANGGDDSLENGRALCRAHNQYMSEKILGEERANRWRNNSAHP